MSECLIILESPQPIYHPGDILNGYVLVNLSEDKKVNKIGLELDGRAHVKFSNGHGRGNYSAEKIYLKDHMILWKKNKIEGEKWFLRDNRKYPFSFVIPSDAAPSVECTYGYIRYKLKAEINLSWALDKFYEVEIKVGIPVMLNSSSMYVQPQSASIYKKDILSFSKSTLATVSIPRLAWAVDEIIPVNCSITNNSSNDISAVEITIIKKENFTGKKLSQKDYKVTKEFVKRINPIKTDVCIFSSAAKQIQVYVPVTANLVTINNCPVINITYELEIKLHFKGILGSPLWTSLPVVFSNIPLVESSPSSQISTIESLPSSFPKHYSSRPPTTEPSNASFSTSIAQTTAHPDSPPPSSLYGSNPTLAISTSTLNIPPYSSQEIPPIPPTEYEKKSCHVTDL